MARTTPLRQYSVTTLTKELHRRRSINRNIDRRAQLREACKDVIEHGVKATEICTTHKEFFPAVTYGTLMKWLRDGIHTKPDSECKSGTRLLHDDAEKTLAAFLVQSAELGNPKNASMVKLYARHMATKINGEPPQSKNLGRWLEGFLERHNEVPTKSRDIARLGSKKAPEGLSQQRQKSMKKDTVSGYAQKSITPFLQKHPELTLGHIGNFDEWMLNLNSAIMKGKIIGPPGLLYTTLPAERDQHMTVLSGFVGTWAAPVMLVFKGVELDASWLENVPDQKGYMMVAVSPNGWITEDLKLQYYKYVRSHPDFPYPDEPVLWQFDGHYTNVQPSFVMTATDWLNTKGEIDHTAILTTSTSTGTGSGVDAMDMSGDFWSGSGEKTIYGDYMSCFPSHHTHGMQPMDATGGPIHNTKHHLAPILRQQFHARQNEGRGMSKSDICYCLFLAHFGGSYTVLQDSNTGETVTQSAPGVTPALLTSALNKVGWGEDRNGKLFYRPEDVIDDRKFKPGARYVGGKALGPVAPEVRVSLGKKRSEPVITPMHPPARNIHMEVAAECLSMVMPSIAPRATSKLTVPRSGQHVSGAFLTHASAAKQRAVKAKEQQDQMKKAAQKVKENDKKIAEATALIGNMKAELMSGVKTPADFSATKLKALLRIMGWKVTGKAHELQSRVLEALTAEATQSMSDAELADNLVV